MLLALETSDRNCAVAIANPATGTLVASVTEDIGRGHAERLMGMIETALRKAPITYKDLTSVVVCVGPGSFTGIRVSLATATGLSIALGIPIFGVTALQALALDAAASGKNTAAVIDAHRGDVFLQMFNGDGEKLDEARQISIERAKQETQDAILTGNGSQLLCDGHVVSQTGMPPVEAIARAALDRRFTVEPKPLYLRRPDAKPQEAYTERRALRS